MKQYKEQDIICVEDIVYDKRDQKNYKELRIQDFLFGLIFKSE